MIVAGIGCRKGVSTGEVNAAIEAALSSHQLRPAQLACLATIKADEPAIVETALRLSLKLLVVQDREVAETAPRQLSRSELSHAATGAASASEAAALAGAGAGSRLLGPRIAVGPVTCALAISEDAT